jgi:hypothetical protein
MFFPSAYSDALERRNRNIVMGLSLREPSRGAVTQINRDWGRWRTQEGIR